MLPRLLRPLLLKQLRHVVRRSLPPVGRQLAEHREHLHSACAGIVIVIVYIVTEGCLHVGIVVIIGVSVGIGVGFYLQPIVAADSRLLLLLLLLLLPLPLLLLLLLLPLLSQLMPLMQRFANGRMQQMLKI